MTAEHFYELLAKKLSGEASVEQMAELYELMVTYPELKNSSEILSTLWQQSLPSDDHESQKLFEWHIQRIKRLGIEFEEPLAFDKTENVLRHRPLRWLWIFAAVVAASFGLFLFFRNFFSAGQINKNTIAHTEVRTRPASRTQMQLPDGSTVWLNASSTLTYAKDFGKDMREVNLSGEAFFDVVKDPAHPFIIHTKVIDVRVLGTAFNVKAYPEDKTTETSLIRGRIELTVKNKEQNKYYLEPNQKIVVSNDIVNEKPEKIQLQSKNVFSPEKLNYDEKDSTVVETSWVENRLIFQQKETFREVAVKMERWFGVRIVFTSESVANLRPFGSFTTETINQALDAFKEFIKFSYKMNGNKIIISP